LPLFAVWPSLQIHVLFCLDLFPFLICQTEAAMVALNAARLRRVELFVAGVRSEHALYVEKMDRLFAASAQ
jgi:hypothetical protein